MKSTIIAIASVFLFSCNQSNESTVKVSTIKRDDVVLPPYHKLVSIETIDGKPAYLCRPFRAEEKAESYTLVTDTDTISIMESKQRF